MSEQKSPSKDLRQRTHQKSQPTSKFSPTSFVIGLILAAGIGAGLYFGLRSSGPSGPGAAGIGPTSTKTQTSWDAAIEAASKKIADEGLQHHPYAQICDAFRLGQHPVEIYCSSSGIAPMMLDSSEYTDIAVYSIAGILHAPDKTPLRQAIKSGIQELLRRKPIGPDTAATKNDQQRRIEEAQAKAAAQRARHASNIPE